MPGYALIERRDLMKESMSEDVDAIQSLVEHLAIYHDCERISTEESEEQDQVNWTSSRKAAGWIVPVATGFQGISEIGVAKNQRDAETPHRFAEAVVTLGEFKMPYQIKSIDEILWRYQVDLENDLYLCQSTRATA